MPDVDHGNTREKASESQGQDTQKYCCFWNYQQAVEHWYASTKVTALFAALILANFFVTCAWRQIDAETEKYPEVWENFENFFNIVFTIELAINMYGSWFRKFFSSSWNIFDMIVVTVGLFDLFSIDLPAGLNQIRMIRAFRVFRLFSRVESLRKILVMIHRAIPGVFSAFVINFLIVCIYAVLAVDFFRELHSDCHDIVAQGLELPPGALTGRNKCFGQDYYGTFLSSLYTLFQILTGESWSEAAVRPVLYFYERSWYETMGVAFFFISFILLNAVVLLNVVVAVLIEGMSGGGDGGEGTQEADEVDDEPQNSDDDGNDSVPKEKKRHESMRTELHHANNHLMHHLMELQADIGGMKSDLDQVSAEMKDSCAALVAELQEHRNAVASATTAEQNTKLVGRSISQTTV